jgi:hypothetical protein
MILPFLFCIHRFRIGNREEGAMRRLIEPLLQLSVSEVGRPIWHPQSQQGLLVSVCKPPVRDLCLLVLWTKWFCINAFVEGV